MIKIKISNMLGVHKMTQKKLAELTGIRPNTISMYYHEKIQLIDKDHLNKMCEVFNCEIEDLIEYVPDEK